MSKDKPPDKNRSLRPGGPERFQPKVILIWMAILTAIVTLLLMTGKQMEPVQDWTISQVIAAAEEGKVARGVIKADPAGGANWTEIRGELKEQKNGQPILFNAAGRLTDDNLQRLQSTGVFKEIPAKTLMTEIILTLLPIAIIIGVLYFLFIRQIRMAGRGAMSFGKSRAKLLTRERDKVTFADVAGCDEAKEDVREIIEFLKDPKKFQNIGGRIPKGCMLVGPPGTGKTLLGKAVAGEADVPFFSISGSDFVEMFVGVGAARVRDMFEQGRKNAPCIIFIDEIDAVGRSRGAGLGGGNDEREQTLNSILVEMDGFDPHEGVIIMAATNRPDVLDSALLRPGRFDRQITIDLPDLAGREEILKVHAGKIKISKETDLSVAARNTPGFSGADLANLLNEAALLAARYGKKEVDMQTIDEARDKIAFGRERRKLMDDEDKKITAHHEAGHAIVQAVIDDGHLPLHKVTIIPRGQSLGSTMFMPKKDILHYSKKLVENQICCAMGGRAAEEQALGEITSGAQADIQGATKIARRMVCDWGMSGLGPLTYGENRDHVFLGREITRTQNYSEETARRIDQAIRQIVDDQYRRAKDIIAEHRQALDTAAQALIEHETLEGKHIHEILRHGKVTSPVTKRPKPAGEKEEEQESGGKKKAKKPAGEELPPGAEPALA